MRHEGNSPMSPLINAAVVDDRIHGARERAASRRMARAARAGAMRRSGHYSIRDVVGFGLIAIGERLVDQPPMPDPATLRRAA
jgi:hypothetical protein